MLILIANTVVNKKKKYFGTIETKQNRIHGEIKSRLNSDKTCYHLVLNLSSSRMLYKNVEVRIYKTINLSVWV
jgi:hypothetical protein